jgi:hypothetical protein
MYFDSLLNLEGAGAGVLLISLMGEQLKYVLQIFWKVSNNKAEYEALLHGETTRISANGTPNLSTSVVVPGGLPRAIPVSVIPKTHTER